MDWGDCSRQGSFIALCLLVPVEICALKMALNLSDFLSSLQGLVEAHELFCVYIHRVSLILGEVLFHAPQLQTKLL